MGKTTLFRDKAECCGCEACVNVCPKKAIHMQEDECGFRYPCVDEDLCVECGLCQKVCGYKYIEEHNEPMSAHVACTLSTDIMQSASGGVFACLAQNIIEQGGIVYGVSMELISDELVPMHIGVDKIEELVKLQGSKYVQSMIGDTYHQVKEQLLHGRKVLFSGTPCQVAGLKAYLGEMNKENLLLVDIICHGVPSVAFFQSYIKELEKKYKGKITSFKFRDKSSGWGLVGKATYRTAKNKEKSKLVYARESSFEKVARKNGQLRYPAETGDRRQLVLDMYVKGGYQEVDAWFRRKNFVKMPFVFVVDRIPVSLKKRIRRMLG